MAHKKGAGSTKNGRDSNSKRLGIKAYGKQFIKAGSLDDSSWLKIESSFWSETANQWDPVDENIPIFEKNPPL